RRYDAAGPSGHVEQGARRDAREGPRDTAPEEVRIVIDRKVEEMHPVEHHREWITRDRDALLHDIRARERREEGLLPLVLVDGPAEHHALSAVLVVRLQNDLGPARDAEIAEVDDLARVRRVSLADFARPRDVLGERGPLRGRVDGAIP